jgi:hypothetical protein
MANGYATRYNSFVAADIRDADWHADCHGLRKLRESS